MTVIDLQKDVLMLLEEVGEFYGGLGLEDATDPCRRRQRLSEKLGVPFERAAILDDSLVQCGALKAVASQGSLT